MSSALESDWLFFLNFFVYFFLKNESVGQNSALLLLGGLRLKNGDKKIQKNNGMDHFTCA
jgi:hypothetical protein